VFSEEKAHPGKQKGRDPFGSLPFLRELEDYFFFLAVFLAGAFLAVFFLAAMENHPLCKSHLLREIVPNKIDHYVTIKFFMT
jgi:hypothetical protein